jgi:hypothetical protein
MAQNMVQLHFIRGFNMHFKLVAMILLVLLPTVAVGQTANMMELPPDVRGWYKNPDGSCVQCSIGMCGVWCNVPQAATLLWDTEYGKKVRGGSWPERVAGYCEQRQIPAYNVTGSETFAWMRWAAKTGRFAAIGAGRAHFQTLYGLDDRGTENTDDDIWFVCNNNSTHKIDQYNSREFRALHLSSGPWVVVLDTTPSPAIPIYRKWW